MVFSNLQNTTKSTGWFWGFFLIQWRSNIMWDKIGWEKGYSANKVSKTN